MHLLAGILHLACALQPGDSIPGKPEYNAYLAKRTAHRTETEYWIELANLTYASSEVVVLAERPPKPGELQLNATSGKDSGKAVASLGSEHDISYIETAVAYLDSALHQHPERIDVQLGKTQLWRAVGDCGRERKALDKFYRYALDTNHRLASSQGRPVEERQELVDKEFAFAGREHWENNDDACLKQLSFDFLDRKPKSVIAMNFLASVYIAGGKDSALLWMDKALEIDPKDPIVLGNKGQFYLNRKDKPNARKWFKAAVDACDDDPELRKKLEKDLRNAK